MAINTNFRTLAFAMRSAVPDSYMLLAAVEAVQETAEGIIAQGIEDWKREHGNVYNHGHESYVDAALRNGLVCEFMRAGKKINAIKELRVVTGCGLKEAKEAVEDIRVLNSTGYTSIYSR